MALGDSFSSGEGAPPFQPDSARRFDTCHRSTGAWPLLLARAFGEPGASLACSGATIRDVLHGRVSPERERRSPQIRRLRAIADVDRVTVTIGGNDVGFAHILGVCLTIRCVAHYANHGHDRISAKIARLAARLADTYRAVRRAAPGARLVVVGYPRLFPTDPHDPTCAAGSPLQLDADEEQYLNGKAHELNVAILGAARAAGARFVDVEDAFRGHELRCESSAPYVNAFDRRHVRFSFHPTRAGQQRLATAIARALHAAHAE